MILLYNYPESIKETFDVELDDGFIELIVKLNPHFKENKTPVMAYYANNFMRELEDFEHTSEARDILNDKGLHVFYGEPLCLYDVNVDDIMRHYSPFNFGFYSEFPGRDDYQNIRAAELDSLLTYIKRNNLTNVTAYTCDYNCAKLLTHYTPYMNLKCEDMFINSLVYFENILDHVPKDIKKKFITTNWRFTTARCITSAVLNEKESHISWLFDCDYSTLMNTPWLTNNKDSDLGKRIKRSLENMKTILPVTLDLVCTQPTVIEECVGHIYPKHTQKFDNETNPVSLNRFTLDLRKFYNDSFVDVVNESRFAQPTANISEKVYQSMTFLTPFILVAPPYSLEYLKKLGFKTFDAWWSEDYDQEEDHWQRMKMIVDLIDQIDSWSYEQLNKIYNEMKTVLQHNFNHLITISRNGKVAELVSYDAEYYNKQYRSKA